MKDVDLGAEDEHPLWGGTKWSHFEGTKDFWTVN